MTAADLYVEMKYALLYFGLNFHEMDKIEVSILCDVITFVHKGRALSVNPKKANFGDE